MRTTSSNGRRIAALLVIFASVVGCSSLRDESMVDTAALEAGFKKPPNDARPRVWWHWLNANISKDGIKKDLEWMQRSGIGGLQNFDVNFSVPVIVDKRVPYMSDEWKEVYRYSVETANELGLEFGIAASPGWSETGGPWVKPEDGMKKLVWSETLLTGNEPFNGKLPSPPSITGPFQDLAPPLELNPTPKPEDPVLYRDVVVLAFPVSLPDALPTPSYTLPSGEELDAALLGDGLFGEGVTAPLATPEKPSIIELHYEKPQTVRTATLWIPDIADIYSGPRVVARLEAKASSGEWSAISDIQLSTVPTTVSFDPVTASDFRLVVEPRAQIRSNSSGSAPGYDDSIMRAMIAQFFSNATMPLNEFSLSSEARVHQFEVKAGYSVAPDYYALEPGLQDEANAAPSGKVIDLTDEMQADGRLDWTPPAGQWRVIRFGYSLLGKTNHPAIAEATGLEVDKLDSRAVRDYVETYLQNYRDAVGDELVGEKGISAILTDSTEVGAFNWTPGLLVKFQKLRGYDALPWLPTLTGEIIGSRSESDKFLYDFRRTIAELHATEHYGTVAKVAHENGLKVYGESLEGWRPSLGDDLGMRRFTDFPMSAVWSYQREEGPKPLYLADMRGASSIAHLYGQNIAAAESMTSTRHPWYHVPADLRRVVDLEFLHGINRIVIHSSVHQPRDDKQPGLSLRHIGQFFNRHTTWAEMARPWIDYMARSSYLLQQGRFVADVAYFYGEEAPLGAQTWDVYLDDVPKQYGYDFVNPDAVFNLLKVRKGDLVTSSGARYKLLYLSGTSERMTLAMLRRIAALAEAGATVLGNPPKNSPGLNDDKAQFDALVAKLWSGQGVTQVGKGRVIPGKDISSAMELIDVKPDMQVMRAAEDADIQFVHRQLAEGELYFVSNRNNLPEQVEARFRVKDKMPEVWRADSGEISPVSYRLSGDFVDVSLEFDAEESYFVVFSKPATKDSYEVTTALPEVVATLDADWKVDFQSGRGAPNAISLPELIPLNEHAEPGVKYFSGVSSYSTTFSLPEDYQSGDELLLDLGEVGDIAELWINGQKVGTRWQVPFRFSIQSLLTEGENELEVRVANRWVNRLIGDAQPDAEKVAYTVMPMYSADAPLLRSGLMGPVRLLLRKARLAGTH